MRRGRLSLDPLPAPDGLGLALALEHVELGRHGDIVTEGLGDFRLQVGGRLRRAGECILERLFHTLHTRAALLEPPTLGGSLLARFLRSRVLRSGLLAGFLLRLVLRTLGAAGAALGSSDCRVADGIEHGVYLRDRSGVLCAILAEFAEEGGKLGGGVLSHGATIMRRDARGKSRIIVIPYELTRHDRQ